MRIALNIKQIPCELVRVDLLRDGGDNHQDWYLDKNPTALVPTLELADGTVIRQSLAILDYLEQICPSPRLIPEDPALRAKVMAWVGDIGMEVHPINNLRVINHLKKQHKFSQEMATEWMHHWMHLTFAALEQMLDTKTQYCFGDQPTLADVFLVPQMFNAKRWALNLSPYPNLVRVSAFAHQQPAFFAASPEQQSDATKP